MMALRPGWTMRMIIVIIITAIFFRCVAATNHSVGGDSGWDLNSNILAWSAATTFQVGDYLVFKYLPVHDVVEVNRTDYSKCRTVNPIRTHNDGETVIKLNQTGSRYFICGRLQHCVIGLKLRVQVLQRFTTDDQDAANQEDPPSPHSPPDDQNAPPPLPPCNICSRVDQLKIKTGRQFNWWWFILLFITLPTSHFSFI